MNRRSFLKSVVACAGLIAIPAYALKNDSVTDSIEFDIDDDYRNLLVDQWKSFNPETRYGNVILLSPEFGKEHLSEVIEVLDRNIYETIPEKYRGLVEYRFNDYGKTGIVDMWDEIRSISWKYSPRHNEYSREVTKAAINAIF